LLLGRRGIERLRGSWPVGPAFCSLFVVQIPISSLGELRLILVEIYISRNEAQKHLKKIASLGNNKEAEIVPEPKEASEE
jgi:hypothetical protein